VQILNELKQLLHQQNGLYQGIIDEISEFILKKKHKVSLHIN
jgi:hypothetical protein